MPSQFESKDVEDYFTNREDLRKDFRDWLTAPSPSKHILIIHGVGGVGKSFLLHRFRQLCKNEGIPVALISGDEVKTAIDILSACANALLDDGVVFKTFSETLKHYQAIQAKVEEQASQAKDSTSTETGSVGKFFVGLGTEALVNLGTEALMDWLVGFLNKSEVDLLLNPADKLTASFLYDLAQVAPLRRIVLMLDTFEHLGALEDWVRDFAMHLHPNVFLIIAGRTTPNWERVWPSWLSQTQIEELKPMSEEDMRTLIRRYYASTVGGEPDSNLVESIVRFGRGLPFAVTTAVRLFAQYGVTDFQTVKPTVVADLVDRLMESVPHEMIPVLEAVATVRWFNKEIIRALTGIRDVDSTYDTLRRFPFVRSRQDGLSLHDNVREILEEKMRASEPKRNRDLHERAADYFERRLSQVTGDEAWKLGLELLFHRVRADEEAGIRLCEEIAEELVRYRRIDRLGLLLNEANAYSLAKDQSRLWREYFNIRLHQLKTQVSNVDWLHKTVGEKAVEPVSEGAVKDIVEYDVFISHAWEDKPFARDLAETLRKKRLKVWYDEFTLSVGDRLRRSIDRGLANSRYGIVILSPYFFAKEWPQKELDGLASRETLGKKIILPVWHNITADQVREYSPTLADRIAVTTDKGLEQVVAELLRAMRVYWLQD